MTLQVGNTTVVNSNRAFVLGSATPGSPTTGLIRWNSGAAKFEVYNGTAWVSIINETQSSPAWAWGNNNPARLGDNTITSRSSPVSVVGGFTDWVQISAGSNHTAALRTNGTAWTWGSNIDGQLGDNTTTGRLSPVLVVGGFTDWVQISAGGGGTAAIRANGTAWCWGSNSFGRLGDGTASSRSSPVSVVGGFTDWVQISPGLRHTAAVRANGTAWCWGENGSLQLGDGSSGTKSSPVSVLGGFTDWVQISASSNTGGFSSGSDHTAAIRANGTAWCWGNNTVGKLGDNTTLWRSSPVLVVGGFTDWVQISAGGSHTVAIRANGTIWSWGHNVVGQIGDGTTTNRSSPVSVVGGFTDWAFITAGNEFTAAIRSNGTAWTWGNNSTGTNPFYLRGQLGDNTQVSSRLSPVSVVGGFTDWAQISAGSSHTAALRSI